MTRNIGVIKLILIGLLFVVSTSAVLYAAIPAEERSALIAIYNATNGDNWERNGGWKTPPYIRMTLQCPELISLGQKCDYTQFFNEFQ